MADYETKAKELIQDNLISILLKAMNATQGQYEQVIKDGVDILWNTYQTLDNYSEPDEDTPELEGVPF